MFNNVLVVCVGNICRSPVGERLLKAKCPTLNVSSAGIAALVGHPADPDASLVAAQSGLSLEGHVSRQFSESLAAEHDLILVMEAGHRSEIIRMYPRLAGKTMLFDQWVGAKGIADPYQLPIEFHQDVFAQIANAADAWAAKLIRKS
jgi:protein-tyrosine phosphatase